MATKRSDSGGRRAVRTAAPKAAMNREQQLLRLLTRLTAPLVGEESISRQARRMARELRRAFRANACVIRILAGDELALLAADGVSRKKLSPRLPVKMGISEEIVSSRRPLYIPEVRQHPLIGPIAASNPHTYQFISYAGAPLLASGEPTGIVGLYWTRRQAQFTTAELDALQVFASNIAVAVTNHELYRELRSQQERMQAEAERSLQIEQALRESERRYRSVVEDQTEMIVRWRPDGTRTFVNDSYCRYFGHSREELIGTGFMPLVATEDRAMIRRKIASFTPQRPVQVDEHRVVLSDGSIGWNEWTDRAIYDEKGHLLEFQSVGRDITERKRLQEQLLQARKMESIATLAGGVAHDFGNLLEVIIGCAGLVRHQPGLTAKTVELLDDIAFAAERGAALTDQMLAYARGRSHLHKPTDLNAVVRSVWALACKRLRRPVKGILKLEPRLPAVLADETQLHQVIMNLCLNAIEAAPGGTCRIEISTESRRLTAGQAAKLELAAGHHACLQVRDQGRGMDSETLQRMFDPFFTTKPMGRGMGLAAALGIIRDHRGQIRVESAPGKGTTVSVWLPIKRE